MDVFFNDTPTTEIYTLSLHDALPISHAEEKLLVEQIVSGRDRIQSELAKVDRKSTRLNSSHRCTSYAVFCLKKKMLVIRYEGPPGGPGMRQMLGVTAASPGADLDEPA